MGTTLTAADPWVDRSRRAAELALQSPYAAELLNLYQALGEVASATHRAAAANPPPAPDLPAYAAREVLPRVIDATLAWGPQLLKQLTLESVQGADPAGLVRRWLGAGELTPTERYLARAAAGPVLEAVPELAAGLRGDLKADARHCPACGGLPQLSYFEVSGEALLTAPRRLLCARCAATWTYPRLVCAGCGSSDSTGQPIYADPERFPGLRADCCEACRSYLITVECTKRPGAIPVVDELTAVPLDLYASERGFRKLIPNLMGIG